jgi:hypothetical protein
MEMLTNGQPQMALRPAQLEGKHFSDASTCESQKDVDNG